MALDESAVSDLLDALATGEGTDLVRELALAGRDPHTDERPITAQGSAGRRPTLGAGSHTRVGADGERFYGVADVAASLRVTRREVERMLDVGTAIALGNLAASIRPPAGAPFGAPGPQGSPVGPPARPPVGPDGLTNEFGQPGGSYLLALVDEDGSRWVRASELERCA